MHVTVLLDNFHVTAFPSSTIRTLNPQLPSYFILCGCVGNTGSKGVCGQDINPKCFKIRWKRGWGSKLRWFESGGIEAWRVENLWKVDHVIRVEREDGVRDFLMRFTLPPLRTPISLPPSAPQSLFPNLYTPSQRITVYNKLYRFTGGENLEGS